MKKIYGVFFLLLALLAPAALGQATSTTIMMYMCGTDLQSACVMDMYEMASVDVPDDVTIAVQAGGAYQWDDSDLTGEAVNRFTISYDTFNDLQTLEWQNMGDSRGVTRSAGIYACKNQKCSVSTPGSEPNRSRYRSRVTRFHSTASNN